MQGVKTKGLRIKHTGRLIYNNFLANTKNIKKKMAIFIKLLAFTKNGYYF